MIQIWDNCKNSKRIARLDVYCFMAMSNIYNAEDWVKKVDLFKKSEDYFGLIFRYFKLPSLIF